MKQARRWLLVAAALDAAAASGARPEEEAEEARGSRDHAAAPAAARRRWRDRARRAAPPRSPRHRRRLRCGCAPRPTPRPARRRRRRRRRREASARSIRRPVRSRRTSAKAPRRTVNAEIYAVQQIYALRYHRFEMQPYWSFTLNDQFVSHPGPGLALNYYITNVLAVGVNGNFYGGLNERLGLQLPEPPRGAHRRAAQRVPVAGGNLNFTYVPMYGKFAGFGDFIFHYDAYVVGGVGAISTRPIAVIDPDNRKFDFKAKLDFDLGIGLAHLLQPLVRADARGSRLHLHRAAREHAAVAPTQRRSQRRTRAPGSASNRLTNNVQAQVGVSIFLPFSWEYRLPK